MRKADNTFAINTGAWGDDWRAEHIVCLLRDLAERLAGNGVDSDDNCRQLRAINHAAHQVLVVTLKDPAGGWDGSLHRVQSWCDQRRLSD